MGAWGERAFDNDTACDWTIDFARSGDLALVEAAFDDLERVDPADLVSRVATRALAACEVVARLRGQPGYQNAYTKQVDAWVAASDLVPAAALVRRAVAAIDRILGERSELRELWEGDDTWRVAMLDLRRRLTG
jgi:hypothetical protein